MLNPCTGAEVERTTTRDRQAGIERSWLSRLRHDLVRFPWGEVTIDDLTGDKNEILPDEVAAAWGAVVGELQRIGSEPPPRGSIAEIERMLQGQPFGMAESTAKKMVRSFRALYSRSDQIWALAESAVDSLHLREALNSLGVELNPAYLYRFVYDGVLQHPDSLQPRS